MGQITNPIVKGITVLNIDRETGPGAGAGQTGNNVLLLGVNAGQNSAINNLVALGSNAASAGIVSATLAGTVDVGVGNISALTTGDGVANHPVTTIGSNNLSALVAGGALIALGSNLFSAYTQAGSLQDLTLIGNNIFAAAGSLGSNANAVIIGTDIGTATTAVAAGGSMIMATRMNTGVATMNVASCVIIGDSISAWLNMQNCVLIGANIVIGTNQPGSSVLIGNGVSMTGNNGDDDRNVVIGNGALVTGTQSTVIGAGANSQATRVSQVAGNVVIGAAAGTTLPANTQAKLVIEESLAALGAVPSTLVYGDFSVGNLVLGNSVQGTNRDIQGTNTLKLLNGTKNAAPVGGGYFYVTGGFLHWVDPNGTDSQLSETVAGQLASSALTAFTNNAAAQVATLTNGPTVGNPTKWIPINDNGTIRNIPAW